nr:unnamed protein product [Digitaria exilis]
MVLVSLGTSSLAPRRSTSAPGLPATPGRSSRSPVRRPPCSLELLFAQRRPRKRRSMRRKRAANSSEDKRLDVMLRSR